MFVSQVVWDHPSIPTGNAAQFISWGYTLDEIEEVLMNRRNLASILDREDDPGLGGITYGTTSSGISIGVIWEAECGNPLHIYPLRVVPCQGLPPGLFPQSKGGNHE